MSLDEETVQQPEEERNYDEQHQGGQIAEDQNEHEPSFDATCRIETLGALGSAPAIAMIAEHDECAATEITSSFEIARDTGEGR